jgi:hypothetical protein
MKIHLANRKSVVYDQKQQLLYVSLSQIFHLFFLPRFLYGQEVSLVTILSLSHDVDSGKYTIESQEDLYQSSELVKFFTPRGTGTVFVAFWQWVATVFCIIGSLVLAPVTWFEEIVQEKGAQKKLQ